MREEIVTITFPLPHRLGTVNCYLVKTAAGFILIDTGFSKARAALQQALEKTGCRPGNLSLILITHGDGDHTGNAAWLRDTYGSKIAVHRLESIALESGDGALSRKRTRFQRVMDKILLTLMAPLFNIGTPDKCRPELFLDEDFDLGLHGWNASVLHLPGHSPGSVGVLGAGGDLFCGDVFWNRAEPGPHMIVDDKAAFQASLEKLAALNITTVYPGHGDPFLMERYKKNMEEKTVKKNRRRTTAN
jgi:hydroxyacylglutathione hydrolase